MVRTEAPNPAIEKALVDRAFIERALDGARRAPFSTGDQVKVSGVVARPELNGTVGTVVEFLEARGRFAVKLSPSGEVVALRATNLVPL